MKKLLSLLFLSISSLVVAERNDVVTFKNESPKDVNVRIKAILVGTDGKTFTGSTKVEGVAFQAGVSIPLLETLGKHLRAEPIDSERKGKIIGRQFARDVISELANFRVVKVKVTDANDSGAKSLARVKCAKDKALGTAFVLGADFVLSH